MREYCGMKICGHCGNSIEEYVAYSGGYATYCNYCGSWGTQECPPDCECLIDGECQYEDMEEIREKEREEEMAREKERERIWLLKKRNLIRDLITALAALADRRAELRSETATDKKETAELKKDN